MCRSYMTVTVALGNRPVLRFGYRTGFHEFSVRDFAKGVAGTVSLPSFSVFFRFFRFHFFPFGSFFAVSFFSPVFFVPFYSIVFPFFLRFIFRKKKKKNGEIPFARPLLRNPKICNDCGWDGICSLAYSSCTSVASTCGTSCNYST